MSYPIYRSPPKETLLGQGDILDPQLLAQTLKGHQDYFVDRFYRFMVLTQTCDLDRSRDTSEFVFLTVVRKLSEAFGMRHVEKKRREQTKRLIRELYDHIYNKRGYFYLPLDERYGIAAESVVDLRVIFSVHKAVYRDLLNARLGTLTDHYAAQLGSLAGYMFNRVAMPGWEELFGGDRDKHAQTEVNLMLERESQIFADFLKQTDGRCARLSCGKTAETYRWLPFGDDGGGFRFDWRVLCFEHAEEYDQFRSGGEPITP